MKITKSTGKESRARLRMTPMIDIVFLLIIFFMCVAEMSKLEIESITLPEASQAREKPEPHGRLTVNVMQNGVYRVNGETYSADDLKRLVRREAIRKGLGPNGNSALPVRIRADAHVPYKYVQRVMTDCRAAKVWMLSFGVSPGETTRMRM